MMKGLASGITQNKWMLTDALSGVTEEMDSSFASMSPSLGSGSVTVAGAGISGDIVIPIYLNNSVIDEYVIKAQQIHDYMSGGR